MPNWCSNELLVYGKKEDINSFVEESVKKGIFKISNLFPIPCELKNTISPSESATGREYINDWEVKRAKEKINNGEIVEIPELILCNNNTLEKIQELKLKFGFDNWHDWSSNNWGTKWDCEAENYNITENTFTTYFESAWSPPINWLELVQDKFPNLLFKLEYMEIGNWFCGVAYTEKDGKIEVREGQPIHTNENMSVNWDDNKEVYIREDGKELGNYDTNIINPITKDIWFVTQLERNGKLDIIFS
jgi:hypothetical protein